MIVGLLAGYRSVLVLSAILSIFGTGLGLVPYLAAWRIAVAIQGAGIDAGELVYWTVLAVCALITKALLQAGATTLSHVAAYRILYQLRHRLVEKLARVPLGVLSGTTSGHLRKIVMEDVEQIEEGIAHAIPDLAAGLSVPILSGVLLLWVDWRMGIAAVAMFPLLLGVYLLTLRATRPHLAAYVGAISNLRSISVQYVRGIREIRTFLHTGTILEELHDALDRMARVGQSFALSSLTPMAILYAGLRANVLVLIPVGAFLYLSDEISVTDLTLFLLLGLGINAPLLKVVFSAGNFFWKLKGASAQISTIFETEELPQPEYPQRPDGYDISFQDVSLSMDGNAILSRVSVTIPAGTTLALVGPSGAGKSTLARLLMRSRDPDLGRILIGGCDLRQMEDRHLEGMVSAVLQDAWLMNATIYENILSGRPTASRKEVEAAARAARVTEFSADLSFFVGEGGRSLSGGQRQRVAIARAILRSTPIVVLDEATAALDPDNEQAVREALAELAHGRTVLVIAHRLDTIRNADQIAFVEAGEISDLGSHSDLLQRSSGYRRLWKEYDSVEGWHLEPGAVRSLPTVVQRPGQAYQEPGIPSGMVARFMHLAGPGRRTLMSKALPMLALEGAVAGAPVIAVWLVLDRVLAGDLTRPFAVAASGFVALCILMFVFANRLSHRVLWQVQSTAVSALQARIARQMRQIPLGDVIARDTGSLEALMSQHSAAINFVTPPALAMRAMVGPLLSAIVLFFLDWRLALLTCAMVPAFGVVMVFADRVNARMLQRLVVSNEMLSARLLDYIQGLPTLRSLGLSQAYGPVEDALETHRRISLSTVTALMPIVTAGWIFLDAGFVILLAGGGWMVLHELMEASTFLLFLVVSLVFYAPLTDAFDLSSQLRLLQKSMSRVGEFLAIAPLPEPETPKLPVSLDLRFQDVHFSYGDKPVLSGINLDFPAGKIHALCGPSGSGKSTILDLIARFWDVQKGHVTIGGVDIRDIAPELRSAMVAVVFQDSYLFDMSVARNLRLARAGASDEELYAAAQAACCHDFIMALPKGYETVIGEGGAKLSGGERQRIALARAFLKDAPIILLDEAAASVDPETESHMRQGLAKLCAGRTVIMIAHRPSTMRQVDQRIEMKDVLGRDDR
ncbi:ABC transporter ATP-binding protein [Paracoccus denitrificans]|jgi:ABC-type multidrug transport system fused ATPase/permease subunit|uniref:Multidrug resistance-like ATP-binding protein MdlB n=1 Tax=Paracoccus denitrificans (strain Pd 1222) TaxID=318586 RepID=A1B1Y2_PARDP|nr:ABC transporter ATP-binding protein [Paracoccus denitrificans]ABL69526.1 ABC transporter related protein [Paracoccus denitrificans PD1222]MBB4626775.1 ABC-type multidrug transport system fused ATPase/permease subunit [Paracoccus denitrificans]MCU7427742.1 ABC transporter ATP-binding protein/permease [Paracoccus denitrificans]QAR25000.1 ABC transporter ATP-binding protein [Paracoccus denitrificans]UPV93819.1 ABC transporter ATP-binding protein/permease [Paracoccus denitrificans]